MSVYRIAYRYANSLMLLSAEKNIFQKISQDADLVYNTLLSSKELRAVLKSPVVKSDDKKSLLHQIFESKVSAESMSFIGFIVEKNREDILFDIFKEFNVLVDKKNGVVKAAVVSADTLSDQIKTELVSRLEGKTSKKVTAQFKVDPALIGGFIVKVEDTVFDASVKNQLRLLRKKFAEEVNI